MCTYGPRDRSFEEQHGSTSISVVVEGSFQYRSAYGSAVLSPGSLLLGNSGQSFVCGHDHGVGDRCVAFYYEPEFFESAKLPGKWPTHQIPALAELAPWIVRAQLAIDRTDRVLLNELAHGLPATVVGILGPSRYLSPKPSAADERRISVALRFVEANLREPMDLELLASTSKMSAFHFLRVFKQITNVTPHQYILRARLRKAAVRLKTDPGRVLEIALESGFGDLSNFNHAFRAEFGESPSQFRGKLRSN
jgi:AraC family transcriptional regulator